MPFRTQLFKIFAPMLLLGNIAAICQRSIQSSLESIRKEYEVPALGGLIQRGEKIEIYMSGLRKVGDSTPATVSDQFHLGSDTKAMTATIVAILVETGKIEWRTKLSDVFPEWAGTMNPKLKDVTLEMLGAHMSGITPDLLGFEDGILLKIAMDPNKSLYEMRAEASKKVLEASPQTDPGSHFEYSNMNYVILGTVIEKIKGTSWESAMRSMIFDPLEMKSCGFGPPGNPAAIGPDQPWPHKVTSEGRIAMPPDSNADNPPALGPAGTVHCSMADWAKFLRIHRDGFNGKSSKILSAKGFKKLHEPYPGQEYTPGGWIRTQRPWADGDVLTHDGSNRYNFASAWIAPKKDMILQSVANIGEAETATDEVIKLLISVEK